ncbi:MAG: NosD domain-containing protein [Candidatus Heimdallarchaeota archaeon]
MNRANKLLSLLILSFIISGIFISYNQINFGEAANENQIVYKQQPDYKSYTNHGPIEINSNDDFISYGFDGSGTEIDPFLIENLNITTSALFAISIIETLKFFVIRDCYISSGDTGIKIKEVSYKTATIEDTLFVNNFYAVRIDYASGTKLINNTGQNNTFGFEIFRGSYVSCINNHFTGGTVLLSNSATGIVLWDVSSSLLQNNTFFDYEIGFALDACNQNNLINNTIINSNDKGTILLENCLFNNIFGNTIVNASQDGIRLVESSYNVITHNHIENCSYYGLNIQLTISEHNVIHHNNFVNITNSVSKQALDDGTANVWYEVFSTEGNYWTNWSGAGSYVPTGSSASEDLYPLSTPVSIDWSSIIIPPLPYEMDDDYEENDVIQLATSVIVNSTYMMKGFDNDFFGIYLDRWDEISVNITYNSEEVLLSLSLYDETEAEIFLGTVYENTSIVEYIAPFDGNYYVKVHNVANIIPKADYNFTLTYYPVQRPDDEFEENDVISEAALIPFENNNYSLIYADKDFFEWNCEKNYDIFITIIFDKYVINLNLYLVTMNESGLIGEVLASSESQESREYLEYKIEDAGVYYILIQSSEPNGIPIIVTSYELKVALTLDTLPFPNYYLLSTIVVFLALYYFSRKKRNMNN